MKYNTSYDFYSQQDILPTYGKFQSWSDLKAHERERHMLFLDKLYLPPRIFNNAQLIEFGPDSGENSLVFALWGASCSLVEPNSNAHPAIQKYFKQFQLTNKLVSIDPSDLAAFSKKVLPSKQFDFVVAEGFIYTVRPESLWINLFTQLAKDDGFVILFYCDKFGNFLELMLKVIYSRVRSLTGINPVETARKLYSAKWDSIPHKRSMESYVMDVMENPFVRLDYFFELQSLCEQMHDGGLYLYSSWPPYKDGLNVHWFKKVLSPEEHLVLQNKFIARSRFSHMFGRKHFIVNLDPSLEKMLWDLLTLTDGLIDRFDESDAMQCVENLSSVAKVIKSDAVMSERQDEELTLQTIKSIQHILHLLGRGEANDLITFCNHDQAFIQSWGMPSQFAVFRKGTPS